MINTKCYNCKKIIIYNIIDTNKCILLVILNHLKVFDDFCSKIDFYKMSLYQNI